MKKKFISLVLAALMIAGTTSFSAFAAMANGTVVIGNKAFDLAYANDPANVAEISNAIVAGGSVYVKGFSGNWMDNIKNKQVDASVIPAVIYKNAAGIKNFDAADKDVQTILSISGINALTVANGTTADKLGLPATVAVKLSDNTTDNVNITWDTTIFDGTKAGTITIKGTLTVPTGKTWVLTEAQKVVSVKVTVNAIVESTDDDGDEDGGVPVDTTTSDLNSATTLVARNYTITSDTAIYGPTVGTTIVNNNVTVTDPTGSSLTLRNLRINGTLAINYGEGDVVLDNVIVNGVDVSNVGSNSLHIRGNTVITSLTVNDANNDAHIIVEGNASVVSVVVNSGANIEVAATAYNAQPFANVILSPKASTSEITLKGTFETVSVTKDAKVSMDANSEITNQIIATAPLEFTVPNTAKVAKVNIKPSSETDVFKLSGNLNNVNVSSVAKLEIKAGNVQVSSETNAPVIIVANSGSTVSVPSGSAIEITGGNKSTREKSSENAVNKILIDNVSVDSNKTITNLPIGTTVKSLLSKMLVSDFASAKVVTSTGSTVSDSIVIDNTMKILVAAENTTENSYTISIAAPVSSTVVTFLDKNLEKVIRDIIGKPTGDILKVDVDKIVTIDAQDKNITDLSGIENLTALTKLLLFGNKITDLRPLRGLINLQQIDLSRNILLENDMINDISPLKGLTNLTSLNLRYNQIDNINALTGLTKLIDLYLNGNKITDYTPVKPYYNNLKNKDFGFEIAIVSSISVELDKIVENSNGNKAVVTVKDQYGNVMTSGYTLSYVIEGDSVVNVGTDGTLMAGAYVEGTNTATLIVKATSTTGEAITGTTTVNVIKGQVLLPTDIVSVDLPFPISALNVLNGTTLADIGLPSTVTLNLKDGTTSIASITFDGGSPTYDGSKAGDYLFTGTLGLPEGVTNNGVQKVEIKVTVLQDSALVISGTVKNPDGSITNSGIVYISSVLGGASSVNVNNGRFLIGGIEDGVYNLVAKDYQNFRYTNSMSKTITIVDGVASVTNIESELTNPAITVTVKNPDGTLSTSGNVTIYSQTSDVGISVYFGGFDSINDSKFIIGGLADGVYNIYASYYGDSQYTNSMTKTITIINGKVSLESDAEIELKLTNPMITGTVKNPKGTLENLGYISIYSKTGGRSSGIRINNGKFIIGGLADGEYDIVAKTYIGSQYTNSKTKTITILDGVASDTNIELEFANPMITGTVKNPDGTLATSGNVSISSQTWSTFISIDNGKFLVGGLEDGEYNIVANIDGDGRYTNSETKKITILDGVASEPNIELDFTNIVIVDFEAAAGVDVKIVDLPALADLKLENKADVMAARDAFVALTDRQKLLVTKVEALTAAEAQMKTLEENNLVIASVSGIIATNVDYATTKDDIVLPAKITLNLSNATTQEVDVTWANTDYDGNKSATYTFTGTYVLPTGVTGIMPTLTASVVVGVDPNLVVANAAVIELQTAAGKDLVVEANLKDAEALAQPAKDAVVKVNDATVVISLKDSITLAIEKITTARTAFNNETESAYAVLKADIETDIAAYTQLASGDLSTQELIDLANEAKNAVVLNGLTNADKAIFQGRIAATDALVAAAQKVIDDVAITVDVFNTTISAATFGAMVNVTLTTEGVENYATATQYKVFVQYLKP